MYSVLDIFILTLEMEFDIIKQSWISITGNESQFEFIARSSKRLIGNDRKKANSREMRLFSKSPRSIITCFEFAVEVELSWPWLATVGTSSKVT